MTGAKAPPVLAWAARLKSCPDTKQKIAARDLPFLKRRERGSLIPMQGSVLGDPNHGEHLLKVRRQPKRSDRLIRLAGFHQHLDHQGNPTRIDVFHLGK